jgi:hypothetical protein
MKSRSFNDCGGLGGASSRWTKLNESESKPAEISGLFSRNVLDTQKVPEMNKVKDAS